MDELPVVCALTPAQQLARAHEIAARTAAARRQLRRTLERSSTRVPICSHRLRWRWPRHV